MGGTEMRNLSAHGGRLYAGNGYWMDRPGPEGVQPAQVLVLDRSTARWRVERSLDERLARGPTPPHLPGSALHGAAFLTNHSRPPLPRAAPRSVLPTPDF